MVSERAEYGRQRVKCKKGNYPLPGAQPPVPGDPIRAHASERVACGGRRPVVRAAARRLSPRDLPLVFRGRSYPLVEPGPAHGLVSRGTQDFALLWKNPSQSFL